MEGLRGEFAHLLLQEFFCSPPAESAGPGHSPSRLPASHQPHRPPCSRQDAIDVKSVILLMTLKTVQGSKAGVPHDDWQGILAAHVNEGVMVESSLS